MFFSFGLSDKLDGKKIDYMVITNLLPSSHVLVVPEHLMENYKIILSQNQRDFDVIKQNLGKIYSNVFSKKPPKITIYVYISGLIHEKFVLISSDYLSQQTIDKFSRATSSLMESGLFEFYSSMANFWFQIGTRSESSEEVDDEPAITLYEFRYPLVMCCGCFLFALMAFVSEMIFFHVRDKIYTLAMQCKQFRFTRIFRRRS